MFWLSLQDLRDLYSLKIRGVCQWRWCLNAGQWIYIYDLGNGPEFWLLSASTALKHSQKFCLLVIELGKAGEMAKCTTSCHRWDKEQEKKLINYSAAVTDHRKTRNSSAKTGPRNCFHNNTAAEFPTRTSLSHDWNTVFFKGFSLSNVISKTTVNNILMKRLYSVSLQVTFLWMYRFGLDESKQAKRVNPFIKLSPRIII